MIYSCEGCSPEVNWRDFFQGHILPPHCTLNACSPIQTPSSDNENNQKVKGLVKMVAEAECLLLCFYLHWIIAFEAFRFTSSKGKHWKEVIASCMAFWFKLTEKNFLLFTRHYQHGLDHDLHITNFQWSGWLSSFPFWSKAWFDMAVLSVTVLRLYQKLCKSFAQWKIWLKMCFIFLIGKYNWSFSLA